MFRYLTGHRAQARKSHQQLEQELLEDIEKVRDDYGELLRLVRGYPVRVIRNCQDPMGNTVLQLVLSQNWRRRRRRRRNEHSDDEAEKKKKKEAQVVDASYYSPPMKAASRWRLLRGGNYAASNPLPEDKKDGSKNAFLKLLHYLIHCTDGDDADDGNGGDGHDSQSFIGGDGEKHHGAGLCSSSTNPITSISLSRYNSLVRIKSAGGSLPLHTACRCMTMMMTAGQQQQQQQEQLLLLDAVEYLLQAYPVAVRCRDLWGNLPLHDACDVAAPLLEVILLLVQLWPESVRITNMDGDLPLHLAAAASVQPEDDHDDTSIITSGQDDCSDDELSKAVFNDNCSSPLSPVVTKICERSEQAPAVKQNKADHRRRLRRREQQQLEIVQYLVDYWPESVHQTNHRGMTPLQRAVASSSSSNSPTNLSVVEFLRTFSDEKITTTASCQAPLLVASSSSCSSCNPFDDDDEACDEPCDDQEPLQRQESKPFNNESEGNAFIGATGVNPFESDYSSDNHDGEVEHEGDQSTGREGEGDFVVVQSLEAEQFNPADAHGGSNAKNGGAAPRDSSIADEDEGGSSSAEPTESSSGVGVELIEDFQIVVEEEPFVRSFRIEFEANDGAAERDDDEQQVDESSGTIIPFDHNSMSAIG